MIIRLKSQIKIYIYLQFIGLEVFYAFQDEINGLSNKYTTNVPIALKDIENFIEVLNNASFNDFDFLLDAVRGKIESLLKLTASELFQLLDHDRNSKIDKNDIKQTWKKIKQAVQDRLTLSGYEFRYINETPVVTEFHLLSLLPLNMLGKYIGLWSDDVFGITADDFNF